MLLPKSLLQVAREFGTFTGRMTIAVRRMGGSAARPTSLRNHVLSISRITGRCTTEAMRQRAGGVGAMLQLVP
jgi:hypothetical protein